MLKEVLQGEGREYETETKISSKKWRAPKKFIYVQIWKTLLLSFFKTLSKKKKKILGYIKHVQVQRTKGRNNGDVYNTHELISIKYALGFEDLIQK